MSLCLLLTSNFQIEISLFDRFNRHRFQLLKFSKLIADMALHGWLKF